MTVLVIEDTCAARNRWETGLRGQQSQHIFIQRTGILLSYRSAYTIYSVLYPAFQQTRAEYNFLINNNQKNRSIFSTNIFIF